MTEPGTVEHERLAITARYVEDRFRFRDLRHIEQTGSLEEARLRREFEAYLEAHDVVPGEVRLVWEVRVEANTYAIPEQVLATRDDGDVRADMEARGLDPDEEFERSVSGLRAAVQRAEHSGRQVVAMDVVKVDLTQDAQQPPAEG